MRATLAQLAPQVRDVSANLSRVQTVVDASEDTDLVMFPELFLSGYELGDAQAVCIDMDGPEVGVLREAARDNDTAIVVGAAERVANGVANSALCISRRGELAGVYRKTHLFGAEAGSYVPGDELLTVELDGRTLGVMICFDVEFPEVARALALRGADLLVTISANPEGFRRDHEVFVPARALENGVPHLYVNRVGSQEGISFGGASMAIDPEGIVLSEAGPEDEELLHAEIGDAGRRDERTRYLELLRPSVYDSLETTVTASRAVPNIRSDRPAETREFFVDLLGFEVAMDLGWVVTVTSPANRSAQVNIITGDDPAAPGISVEVADVDAVHAMAVEQGFEIAYSLRDEDWGVRRFMLREPSGTLVNVVSHRSA